MTLRILLYRPPFCTNRSQNKINRPANMANGAGHDRNKMRLFLYLNGMDEDSKCEGNITKVRKTLKQVVQMVVSARIWGCMKGFRVAHLQDLLRQWPGFWVKSITYLDNNIPNQ